MAAIDEPEDACAEEPNGVRPRRPRQSENDSGYNPYLAFAGIFKDDPFIDDIEAFIEAERQRERDEAARLADLEDAQAAAKKEGHDLAAPNNPGDMRVEAPDGTYASWSRLDESDPDYNPYVAFAGIFEDDPFAAEVEAHWMAERQRQRDEAAAEADREDAARAIDDKEELTMAATDKSSSVGLEEANSIHPRQPIRDENDLEYNPYVAFAGIFKDSPFIDEVDSYWMGERQRERDEAARLADLEDAEVAAEVGQQDVPGTSVETQ